jgi:ATP-dependent RNA helicase DeaD
MRPADVVGAIANEAQVSGRSVGAIQIADDYTLVDVPESDADTILQALARGSVRGRNVPVRRDR